MTCQCDVCRGQADPEYFFHEEYKDNRMNDLDDVFNYDFMLEYEKEKLNDHNIRC